MIVLNCKDFNPFSNFDHLIIQKKTHTNYTEEFTNLSKINNDLADF